MFKKGNYFILIWFNIFIVVCSHYDYYDDNDYSYDDYSQLAVRQLYDTNDRRMRVRPIAYYASQSKRGVNTRGIVSTLTGIVSTGKCVVLCLTKNLKNCEGLIGCSWKCFSNDGMKKNQDDSDIKSVPPTPQDAKSENITPSDLVRLVICMVQCISRYLPRSLNTLQQFGTCFAVRCVCADS